jgi:hypothetical protein
MYFDGEFRHIGTIDAEPLVRVIESFGEDAWFEYGRRQETFQPHLHTQTIPLLYDEDMRHSGPTAWPRLAEIKPVLDPVLDLIRKANPSATDGYFVRIILTRLNPGSRISRHRDSGDSLLRSHRNHLALTTNKLVEFEIDTQVQHFAAGEIWEINNRKYHAVRNASEEPRIHMILDYVAPGEKVEDPDEGLVVA